MTPRLYTCCACPGPPAGGLFGRHVRRRAGDSSIGCDMRFRAGFLKRLGKAKIKNARCTLLIHQNIGGLEIAVDHADLVRVLHRFAYQPHHFDDLAMSKILSLRELIERLAIHQFHRVVAEVVTDAAFVDAGDMRMNQFAGQPNLPLEARPGAA